MDLASLNDKQREAVLHTEGPLLLIAGAGAGKTRVLTYRIAQLVENGVPAESILAVTFTNKAAKEMRDRVRELLGHNSDDPWQTAGMPFVSTFHSLGVYILKEQSRLVGLSRWFAIYDKSESLSLIKKAARVLGLDPKEIEPRRISGVISKEKGNMVRAEEFAARKALSFHHDQTARIWLQYEKMLREAGALDFDDLLLKTVTLLRDNDEVRHYYQDRFKYIHIDEYQDTNKVQYIFSKLLAEKSHNICVVGDMDQNIYSWRGANVENILKFEKDFPETTTILLEQNYRSTQNILEAANEIIKKNKNRKEKNLFTENKAGEKITLYTAIDEIDEAEHVANEIASLVASGTPTEEIAILYRANFQSRLLEESCIRHSIPYHVLGTGFFERREVKEMLAFLKSALNPSDPESLSRIINIPKRGIGDKTLEKILAGKREELTPRIRESLAELERFLKELRDLVAKESASKVVEFIFKRSGIKELYEAEREDGEERLENIGELISLSKAYDQLGPERGVEKLMEEAGLVSDQDSLLKNKNGVRLLTVHAAKGLEFAHVFIVGLEQDLFPHARHDEDASADREEEERRLFYVALTRAREQLHLSYATSRMVFGSRRINIPSEFVTDIPEHLLAGDELGNPYRSSEGTNLLGNFIDF